MKTYYLYITHIRIIIVGRRGGRVVVYSCAGETSRCCKYDQSWFKMLFQLKEDLIADVLLYSGEKNYELENKF